MDRTKDPTGLAKTLTAGQATGLAISIVVGSGLLVLPGLAYHRSGGAALHAWMLDALLVLPLLVIFANLGARFPSAGGIAGFVQAGFGRPAGGATELLALGTLSLGLPTVAISGGYYLAAAIGGGAPVTIVGTFLLLTVAGIINWLGARVSGRVQQILAFALVALLTGAALAGLLLGERHGIGTPVAPLQMWRSALPSLTTVFFAYTGWEILSFTAEEYRNPKRDFPIAVGASYLIIVVLYLLVALAVQLTLPIDHPDLTTAPIAAMLSTVVGARSGQLVALASVIIIAANLIGAAWGASRLVFSSAREGLLPTALATVDARSRAPRNAVATAVLIIGAVCIAHFAGLLPLDLLFRLAGQNFMILYALSVATYLKLARDWISRVFGAAAMALVLTVMGTFDWGLAYALALMLSGATLARLRRPAHPDTAAGA